MEPISRLFDIVLHQDKFFPSNNAFNYKDNNVWKGVSTKEFIEAANKISTGLLLLGIKKGDNIGLVSTSRWEWHLIDFAIAQIGAVCVPLYTSLSENEYQYIIEEAEFKIIFVSNESLYKSIHSALQNLNFKPPIYTIDEISNTTNYKELFHNPNIKRIQQQRDSISPNDLLTIIYTSGTEGKPKGVMLSHSNIVSNIIGISNVLKITNRDVALTFLPLNHIYEKTVSYFYLYVGCKIYYAESLVKVIDNAKEIQPTIFTSIPLLMKKIYDKIIEKGDGLKGIKSKIFNWALDLAKKWNNEKPSLWYSIQQFIADKLVYF